MVGLEEMALMAIMKVATNRELVSVTMTMEKKMV